MDTAIVIKSGPKPNSPYLGTVKPLLVEFPGKFPSLVDEEDFPNNGEIFIANGYERDLEDQFSDGELFRIRYRVNNHSNADPSSQYFCHYMAVGEDAEELARNEYFHVVEVKVDADDLLPRSVSLRYKPRRFVVLKSSSSSSLYGPFDYDEPERQPEDGSYHVKLKACQPLSGFPFPSPNYLVLKVKAEEFLVFTTEVETVLLANLDDFKNVAYEGVDFIPDEDLIKWGNDRFLYGEKLPKKELRIYKEAAGQLSETDRRFDVARRERLVGLVERLESWTSQRSNIINKFLDTSDGQAQIERYIQEDSDKVLQVAEERFGKELGAARKQLEVANESLEQQKRQLEEDLKHLTVQKEQTQEQRQQDITQELEERRRELQQMCDAIGVGKDIQMLRYEYYRLDQNKKEKEEELRKQETRLKELQETQAQIAREVKTDHETLKRKLAEVARDDKPYLDILNGIIPSVTEDKPRQSVTILKRQERPKSAKELVEEVRHTLEHDYGRDYGFETVANCLVCIQQNFLTVFAGLPGVGKTSLATYLAKALGLQEQRRFLSIPTSRGLTSQRDILGYYNPLSQRYQPSATGLYEFLRTGDREGDEFPFWVLLDEANLSPIEHYFSSLLGMCDDYVEKKLETGEPGPDGSLILPSSLRFLATINYDNTTEPLSPRVIDRVSIIYVDPPEESEISGPDVRHAPPKPEAKGLLSSADFQDMFAAGGDTRDDALTDSEGRILKGVVESLRLPDVTKGLPVIVSPRKWELIRRYCSAARDLLRGEGGKGSPLRALDYAVAQHILPLINGNGDKYRKRLADLQSAVGNLDKSSRILKRIVEVGDEDQQFYRFFC